jgi:hypothetical protein
MPRSRRPLRPALSPGEERREPRRIRPAPGGFKAGRRVLKSRVREIGHVHVSRIANSSRVGPDMVRYSAPGDAHDSSSSESRWICDKGVPQLQAVRMARPPGGTRGAHPGIAHFPASPFSTGSCGWCNQDMPERHHHGLPGSTGITSNPGAVRSCASHRRHVGFSPRRPSRPGRALSSGAAGTATVTPGQAAASAATARRAAAPRIRLQAIGSPLRPGMRRSVVHHSGTARRHYAARSGEDRLM